MLGTQTIIGNYSDNRKKERFHNYHNYQYLKPKHVITRLFHAFLHENSVKAINSLHSLTLLRFVIIITSKRSLN